MGKTIWYDKNQIEEIADHLRHRVLPDRSPFTKFDAETFVSDSFPSDELVIELDNLTNYTYGKCYMEGSGLGVITIDNEHYLNANKSKLDHTFCHELGHFVLHKPVLEKFSIFADGYGYNFKGEYENGYKGWEWQANYFAGALRIPACELKELVFEFFQKIRYIGRFPTFTEMFRYLGEDLTSERIKTWAELFGVSTMSMAIRLRYLNLLNMNGSSFIRYDHLGSIKTGFI